MHVLVTRPTEQSERTKKSLEILGHSCIFEPLLFVEQIERIERPKTSSGILLTSSNAIAPLKSLYSKYEREILPVLTTGSATAEQARNAGFYNIEHVQGSALDLVKVVPEWMRKNKIAQDMNPFSIPVLNGRHIIFRRFWRLIKSIAEACQFIEQFHEQSSQKKQRDFFKTESWMQSYCILQEPLKLSPNFSMTITFHCQPLKFLL